MLRQWGRSFGYLMVVGFSAPASLPLLMLLPLTVMTVFLAGIGLVLAPFTVLLIRCWTDVHRMLVQWYTGEPLPRAFTMPSGGILARLRRTLTDPTTFRDIVWLLVNGVAGFALGLGGVLLSVLGPLSFVSCFFWWVFPAGSRPQFVTVSLDSWGTAMSFGLPFSLVAIVLGYVGAQAFARVHAGLSRGLLAQSKLAARVEELAETRAGAVSSHDAELRRIERDLHDGTQARLVSIAMRLGVAEKSLDDKDPVAGLVREAREGAEQAMGELRDVIRTMYPPILADRGLDGALVALGARCPVPAGVEIGELGKVPAPVEAAAYFVVAESLTNIAKHSGASAASVRVVRDADHLVMIVSDNGSGGIDESLGTGVIGMRRRVAALDGVLTVDSPLGGPTVISVEIPCGS